MNRQILRARLKSPQSRQEIVEEFCRGKVVLDLGCVQHDIENADDKAWLHKQIVNVADETLGVDFVHDAITSLAQRGYKVMQGDVSEPLNLDRRFDVIVVGNLIEHLSNFEGLMRNLGRLLKPNGIALISTANPFYSEQYFFSAFKNDIIVNPEHTCWLDPITLNQLCSRFGFDTVEVRWVREGWKLYRGNIFSDDDHSLDIFTDRWNFNAAPSLVERIGISLLNACAPLALNPGQRDRINRRYGNDSGRYLFLHFKGRLFGMYWWLRRCLVPMSDINKFELFVSVVRKVDSELQK